MPETQEAIGRRWSRRGKHRELRERYPLRQASLSERSRRLEWRAFWPLKVFGLRRAEMGWARSPRKFDECWDLVGGRGKVQLQERSHLGGR